MKMKQIGVFLLAFALSLSVLAAGLAEKVEITETMRVINCESWVSLRELPAQNSERLKKVPLGALVYHCVKSEKGFAACQYEGVNGYILYKYLEPISGTQTEASADEESAIPMEEILQTGYTVLDWREYNIRVLASRIFPDENGSETLLLGCYIDQQPIWNVKSTLKHQGTAPMLDAFMGGKIQDPQVMLYNEAQGLSMVDLLTGQTMWVLNAADAPVGGVAAAYTDDSGVLYLASVDGQKIFAVSSEGKLLWTADIKDTSVDVPVQIGIDMDEIEVVYQNGKKAYLEFTGEVIGVYDEKPAQNLHTEDGEDGAFE